MTKAPSSGLMGGMWFIRFRNDNASTNFEPRRRETQQVEVRVNPNLLLMSLDTNKATAQENTSKTGDLREGQLRNLNNKETR